MLNSRHFNANENIGIGSTGSTNAGVSTTANLIADANKIVCAIQVALKNARVDAETKSKKSFFAFHWLAVIR